MTDPVYLSGLAAFMPNDPVDNDSMERVLGMVGTVPSRVKRRILKSNGIQQRYYALDPETGEPTHTNVDITVEAIRRLARAADFAVEEMDCLACGTTTPDQLIPNHASMVHGALGSPPAEVISTTGVCVCGITALKYAAMNVQAGYARRAVATATELASSVTRAGAVMPRKGEGDKVVVPFEEEFLRWMLSDGAGAVLVTREPRPGATSLRIDWIEIVSFAGDVETCMYWGGKKQEDGSLLGWHAAAGRVAAFEAGMFNVAQDARLLGREVCPRCVRDGILHCLERHTLAPDDVDWFVPHYSSEFFRDKVHDSLVEAGFPLPYEKWFNNLTTKGNTGSASIYIMLEELVSSGRLRDGQKVLCFIPESARFSTSYVLFTAVES